MAAAIQSGNRSFPESDRIRLTVVIPTLDEANQIAETVSAAKWADEVIVADGGSSDKTRELAQAAGARVIEARGLTIGAQRNVAIEAARNDWILALDADERAEPALVEEIARTLAAPRHGAYRIRFRNFYLGREIRHGRWARDWHVRLFKRHIRFGESKVHETVQVSGPVGELRNRINHVPYRDIPHHVRKIILYARLGAEDLYAKGRRATFKDLALNHAWRFTRDYFAYGSWRDGRVGFVLCALSGFATFLKYATLLAIELENKAATKR